MLKLEDVTKKYGGLAAVSGVTLSFPESEICAVIGPNGTGKTTLFSLIAGSLAPTSGCIRFRGTDITGWRSDRVCRLGIGRTFQVVRPFKGLTVREHLRAAAWFGGGSDRQGSGIEKLLELTHLKDRADWPASRLTLAGCKRLEIARALATGASLLLLDETMAGLTPEETQEAVELVRSIRNCGCGVILIEHVLAAVRSLSDRVVVLDYGRIIADGRPDEVLASDVVKKAYLGE